MKRYYTYVYYTYWPSYIKVGKDGMSSLRSLRLGA